MKNIPIILLIFILFFVIVSGCTKVVSTPQLQVVSTPQQQVVYVPQVTPTKSIGQLLQEIEDEKANSISKAIDYTNPITRDFAVGLVKNTNSGSYEEIGVNQICDIWDAIRPPYWTYVSDPRGPDYYSLASRTINNGLRGDCDDFAILNAAVVQSIGGSSKIITACESESSCHAYAVVRISNNEADLQSTTNYIGSRYGVKTVYYLRSYSSILGESYWLNLDWFASNPGGKFFNDNGEIHVFYPEGGHYVSANLDELIISQTVTPTTQLLESKITYNTIPTPAPTFTLLPPDQRLYAPTPTPTIDYDWSFKLTK